ncbi:MAG: hypothetical protein NT023_06155 [Armatimonadetes bacterium]|nr:hypothetical protein [Armatimonadota bacterium]
MMRNTIRNQFKMWKPLVILGLLAGCLFSSALSASAASLSFSVNGTNAATGTSLVGWANFVYDSATNNLSVQVINGSGIALQSTDVLTGIYWQRTNLSASLSPASASATGTSIIWNKTASSIGSMWQFNSGIAGPSSTNEAITTVSGIKGGIVNGISKTSSSNTVLTSTLVQNEMTFNLNSAKGFNFVRLTRRFQNVYFQFGGSLSGPRLLAKLTVPEPGTVALLASMSASSLMVGFRRYRRYRTK